MKYKYRLDYSYTQLVRFKVWEGSFKTGSQQFFATHLRSIENKIKELKTDETIKDLQFTTTDLT